MVRRMRMAMVSAFVLVAAGLVGFGPTPAAHADAVSEWLSFVNNVRAQNGVAPLQISGEAAGLARQRSQINSASGTLVHTSDLTAGVAENWTKLGENIGVGGSVSAIGSAFIQSPTHFKNIVEARYTHIGVGVVWTTDSGTGAPTQYVTHRFIAIAGASTPPPGDGPSGGSTGGSSGGSNGDNNTPPVTQAPKPPVMKPPVTVPPVTAPPPTGPIPTAPETTATPAPADSGRVSAVLDALHQVDS